MAVTITSYVPAFAGGTVTTGTLIINAPNQGVSGQLAMLFMNPDELLIGTGTNQFSVETVGDILDGTFGTGYSYNDLILPISALNINNQFLTNVLDPVGLQDAATKNYVDTQVGLIGGPFLPISGGVMTGNIDMNTSRVTFDADANTFIHSPFDDYLELVTNGTNAMLICNGPLSTVGFYNNRLVDVADPTSAQEAATKNYVDTQLGGLGPFLPLSGASAMTGDLDMGTNNIINVNTVDGRDISADGIVLDNHVVDASIHRTINDGGVATTDLWSADKITTELALKLDSGTAATTYLALTGDTMLGNIAMGTNSITGMADPTLAQDAATKNYVDTEIVALGLVGVGPYLPTAGGTMLGTLILDADPTAALGAATKQYVDNEISGALGTGFLKLDGTSTMAGALDMGTNPITDVVDPTLAQDAATKNYVDTEIVALGLTGSGPYLKLDGTTPMTGALDMGTNSIGNVVDPSLAQDAATKNYVDTEITALSLGGTGPFLQLAGGTMTGDIDMNGNQILNSGTLQTGDHVFGASDYTSAQGGNSFRIRLDSAPTNSTPTYSFNGDPDTGINGPGSNTVVVACGGAAHLTVSPSEVNVHNKRVVDCANPVDPNDAATKLYVDNTNSIRVLGTATGIDLLTNGVKALYTVPTGQVHIVTDIILRITSYVPGGSPGTIVMSAGTSGLFDQLVKDMQVAPGIVGAGDQAIYLLREQYPSAGPRTTAPTPNAGTPLNLNITSTAVGTITSFEVSAYVLGFIA